MKNRVTLLLVFIVLILSSCQSEQEKFITECKENLVSYMADIEDPVERWNDAFDIAVSTPRMSLADPIQELQAIAREVKDISPPSCLEEAHNGFIDGMDTNIEMMLGFLADADYDFDARDIDIMIANMQIEGMTAAIDEYKKDPDAFVQLLWEDTQIQVEETIEPVENESMGLDVKLTATAKAQTP